MHTPTPRGRLSAHVLRDLRDDPGRLATDAVADSEEDEALTLWALHELSYAGFDDVADEAEWLPSVLTVRHELEERLEARLRKRWADAGRPGADGVDEPVGDAIFALVDADDAPSVARRIQTEATAGQAHELLRMRSIYHLKESDPVAWVVPRLPVRAKAALMELQFDEYGAGQAHRLHHAIFARGLREAGLSEEYGAYIDDAPLEALEQNNTVSMFGLHRRLRGAAMGHLAAFEATSAVPSRRMAQGLERLGLGAAIVDYYEEHVVADSVHDQLAARVICESMVDDDPRLRDDVLLGAWTCLDLEARFATMTLARWDAA